VQWCYVGKRNLEEAARQSGVPIAVQWEPFFLDTTTPAEGRDLKEYITTKYGPEAAASFAAPDGPLDTAGRAVGIAFNKSRRIINTLDGHRVMEWCNQNQPALSDHLMEILFKAYFVEAKDLSNRDVLLDVCVSAGLVRDTLSQLLSTGKMSGTFACLL
jgi:predicted DsbA family dithiol-disulfide isomerase